LYNLVGLRPGAGYFFYYYLVVFAASCNGIFLCQMMSSISSSTQAALQFFPVMLFFSLAFSGLLSILKIVKYSQFSFLGFIIYLPDFPSWLGAWAPYASFLRYAFQGLVENEFKNNNNLPLNSVYLGDLGFNSVSSAT
jgi:hypothetical protein